MNNRRIKQTRTFKKMLRVNHLGIRYGVLYAAGNRFVLCLVSNLKLGLVSIGGEHEVIHFSVDEINFSGLWQSKVQTQSSLVVSKTFFYHTAFLAKISSCVLLPTVSLLNKFWKRYRITKYHILALIFQKRILDYNRPTL